MVFWVLTYHCRDRLCICIRVLQDPVEIVLSALGGHEILQFLVECRKTSE